MVEIFLTNPGMTREGEEVSMYAFGSSFDWKCHEQKGAESPSAIFIIVLMRLLGFAFWEQEGERERERGKGRWRAIQILAGRRESG